LPAGKSANVAQESFTVTGEGIALLSAGRTVTTAFHGITVLGSRPQILSVGPPRRVMQAGWWAICVAAGVPANRTVLWWKYIEFELESYKVALNGNADCIMYRLNAGVTCKFTIGP
jgi:hypothetical protein